MAGKTLIQMQNPVTQSVAAIKALLSWKGHPINPLPADVSMDNGRLVLVLSNKKDSYYTVTAKACSCPAAVYHHGPCKHQRKYFAESKPATKPTDSDPLIKRGGFRPIDTMPGEERAKASSLSAIDCFDTRDVDAAYWSIREDRYDARCSLIMQASLLVGSGQAEDLEVLR